MSQARPHETDPSPKPQHRHEGPLGVITYQGRVGKDWIDANDHMNVSWYDRVFDAAEKRFFEVFGIDDHYIQRTGLSFFRLERLVRYERELQLDDRLEARSHVVWTDFRRVHHFHELRNVGENFRAAWVDAVSIHVDLSLRKSVPISLPEVKTPLEQHFRDHSALRLPEGVPSRKEGRRLRA